LECAGFKINSEPHTWARPSIRVDVITLTIAKDLISHKRDKSMQINHTAVFMREPGMLL